jgi:fatty-acyl-CoA synthase
VRVAVGNGLRADIWEEFQRRFDIPLIREFYSATEAPGVIINITGKVGSIGHVPFRRLSAMKLARYDVEQDELIRGADGFCVECGADEVGELLIELKENPKSALGDFRGYTDPEATRKKQLHDVFRKGDRYFRSGDLMRFDANDYFYFVDRIGDTFRWRAKRPTAEAEDQSRPGIKSATVVGVSVPGAEAPRGLAALNAKGLMQRVLGDRAGAAVVRAAALLATDRHPFTTGTFKIKWRSA